MTTSPFPPSVTGDGSNNTGSPPENPTAEEAMENYAGLLRAKILFALTIYPAVSPSMLHVALGTATNAQAWKSVLNELIAEGLVVRKEISATSPHDRVQTYTVIHLAETAYEAPAQ